MVAKLRSAEIAEKLTALPGWSLDEERNALFREIRLRTFSETFALMTRIAIAAEQADHHPEWSNVYNRLSIWLTTHDAGGITERDFALAARINAFLGE